MNPTDAASAADARLLAVLDRIAGDGARLAFGPIAAGDLTFAALALDRPALDLALARQAAAGPAGATPRMTAAFLAGGLAYRLGLLCGGLALAGMPAGRIAPNAIGLRGAQLVCDPAGIAADGAGDPAPLCGDLLAPVIASLARRGWLSEGALWRLAGDALATAALEQGRALDLLPQALALGRGLLAAPGALRRRADPYAAFPGGDGRPRWFALRAGCCRADDAGAALCDSCCRRDPVERAALLAAFAAAAP